jgi:hypothetical protein
MDPDAGLIMARTADDNAVVLGTLKCGKIWFCPVCSAKIRHGRAQEITTAVVSWLRQGGRAMLVTFTARHAASHQLGDLMDAIQGTRADKDNAIARKPGAYQRLISGAAWAGDKRRRINPEGIRGRIGYLGMIRATEITVGLANGWHPHIHAIVMFGGTTEGERGDQRITGVFEPSASAMAEFEDHFRGVWTRHLAKVDPAFTPSDEHGVDFKPLETEKDASDLGEYIAKLQDGDKAISPANELARADMKDGRFGNMTPFQMLHRIGELLGGLAEDEATGEGSLSWCLVRWREYEVTVAGRRAIEWTRHLRALLGIDGGDSEEDDLDQLFALDGATEFRDGAHLETAAWHRITHEGLDLAATEATEAGCWDTLEDLVLAAGGKVSEIRILTPGEITEAWERTLANLAERRERAAARRRVEAAGTSQ